MIVAPTGTVTLAGPKLKLSIFTSAPLAGLSPELAARFGLIPTVNTSAIAKTGTNPRTHLFLFIIFSPFEIFIESCDFRWITPAGNRQSRASANLGHNSHARFPARCAIDPRALSWGLAKAQYPARVEGKPWTT